MNVRGSSSASTVPVKVRSALDAPLVRVARDAQRAQPLDDLDRQRPDAVSMPVAAELARRAHGVLLGADRHGDERVGHPEVGVLAEPGDDEQLVAARVHVEVVAVVEVAVRRGDVVERVGGLVGEELVERSERHGRDPTSRCHNDAR